MERYKIAKYSQWWWGIIDTTLNDGKGLYLRKGSEADPYKPISENNKLLLFKSKDEAQKYVDDLMEEDTFNVQYGVHQFSTGSIIFRGTEEECAKYIDDRPELWDDAEVYFMTPDDPHYTKEQNEQELKEDMNEVKKYIVFHHSNPDTLYLVKNIPDDSWIWDSDYIIEDVTDKHGNCLIENNDEYISVGEMGDKTLSDFDKEIIASLKKAIEEDPNEEYLCAYTSEDREFCFEKDELPDDLDSMTPFTDFVENSYVDGDSNSQYQVINLDTEDFGEFGVDIFADDEEDGIDEEDHKTYPEYSWYTFLKDTLKTDYEKYPEREDHYLAIVNDLDSKLKTEIIKTLQDLGAKNIDFIDYYVNANTVYFEMSPKVLKRIYNNMINGFNIFADEDTDEDIIDEDRLYSFEAIEEQLKLETDAWTKKEGSVSYANVEEVVDACKILNKKGYDCSDASKYNGVYELKYWKRLVEDRKDLEYQLDRDEQHNFDESQLTEGYSREGYSWDEVNGMIHIYEDGKLIDKYPDMESAEDAGWDLEMLNESLDSMREKALKMKENSDAFAILYGYRVKDKEVELEPEEFSTYEEYRDRIQQITDSFTKLSDKDPRGNRYGYEHNIEFYTVYPNKKQNVNENASKWNIGSDKSKLTSEEIALLDELAQKLESNSPNMYKYAVQFTYEDYGAGMQWYTIVCYDKKGNHWQVLSTKEWLDLMNTGDVEKVYNSVVSDEYFQDKEKDLNDMNMGDLFAHNWDNE